MTTPDTPARPPTEADAHLQALFHYTEGFYASAIDQGMNAHFAANAVAHVERAARALHRLAGAVEPPVAWARETSGGLHVCYLQKERPKDAPWEDGSGEWTPLYAATPVAIGWLPIESAPKDGTWIVGAEWQQAEGYDPELSTESVQFSSGMWCYKSGAACRPTYWMPRPPGAASSTPAPEPLGWHLLTKDGRVVRWHDSLHTFDPREGGFSGMPARADEMDPDHAPHHWSLVFAAPTQRGQAIPSPDMPAICAALGFDPTNHHNAAKCPYCTPDREAAIREGMLRLPGCVKPDTDKQVFFYEQDFYVLSNFSSFRLKWKAIDFDTSEHAYHCEKFWDTALGVAHEIQGACSAHEAFKIAERNKEYRRHDWDEVKVDIMRRILTAKAWQHEYVRRKLLATGDRELIEDSWRDDFWGWGKDKTGLNMLGKLWMEIRAELRSAKEQP